MTDLRHYNGRVNLIDFTRDLYIALFFACDGASERDGQLIFLKTDGLKTLSDIKYDNDKDQKLESLNPVRPAQVKIG